MTFEKIADIVFRVLGDDIIGTTKEVIKRWDREFEYIVFLGNRLRVKDIGLQSAGKHGYEIVIGKKKNLSFGKDADPLTSLGKLPDGRPDPNFKPYDKYEEDVRILYLNDMETEEEVIEKLTPIAETQNRNNEIPALQYTPYIPPAPVTTFIPKTKENVMPEKEITMKNMSEMMTDVAGALNKFSEKIDKLDERVNSLETTPKKKAGRPPKENKSNIPNL